MDSMFLLPQVLPIVWKGSTRRTETQEIALATRIIDNRHEGDVIERSRAALGGRSSLIQPVDLARNTLRSFCDRLGKAYHRPPAASGLTEDLARALGDYPAQTTVARYATIGARPLPTPMIDVGTEVLRYRIGVGFGASLLDYSRRSRRIVEKVIAPDDLALEYGDDPYEPTVIRHRGKRTVNGREVEVIEVYDLTDLDRPSYRVWYQDRDVTAEVFGETYTGDGYWWRDPETGEPYHRVVVSGSTRDPFRTLPLVEATLIVAVRWSAWGLGTDHASHPQRNVRGLMLAGGDTASGEGNHGEMGAETGPESVVRWVDEDPQRPGDHWQDAPAYDPETLAKAIRVYETSAMSALGLPVDYEATGGEPTAREAEQLAEMMSGTYPECRRWDGERLRRASAMARSLAARGLLPQGDYPAGPFGLLYRDEITAALGAASGTNPQDDALTGVQISGLLEIAAAAGTGALTTDAAVAVASVAFPTLDETRARRIIEGATKPTEEEDDDGNGNSGRGRDGAERAGPDREGAGDKEPGT